MARNIRPSAAATHTRRQLWNCVMMMMLVPGGGYLIREANGAQRRQKQQEQQQQDDETRFNFIIPQSNRSHTCKNTHKTHNLAGKNDEKQN